jgi:hypothetical protein
MSVDTVLNGLLRLILPVAAIAAAALAVFAVLDRLTLDRQAAARRALTERSEQLTHNALAPGSALACLDGGIGETTENACEAVVFASPQSTAAAVGYTAARLTLLADAQNLDPDFAKAFAASRRALELDRFGIAAHVLAARDGCTAEDCAAFALFADASALKANLKAQAFDQYVSRHAAAWSAPASQLQPNPPAVSQAPEPSAPAIAAAAPDPAEPKAADAPAHPMSSKYSFPSAASIPPVSIMNAEPPLSKAAAEAQAAQPKAEARPEAKAESGQAVPVPPKRPQAPREQADTPVAR